MHGLVLTSRPKILERFVVTETYVVGTECSASDCSHSSAAGDALPIKACTFVWSSSGHL